MEFDRNIYDTSNIDWNKINALAKRVAKETKAPRFEHDVTILETKERTVSCGFLNLQRRVETYQEKTAIHIVEDYWVLEQRIYWSEEQKNDLIITEKDCNNYCLRSNGALFFCTDGLEEVAFYKTGGSYYNKKGGSEERAMNDEDVTLLDFWALHRDFDETNLVLRDSRQCSEEIKFNYQTKGEGIIKLLNDLLAKKI
jgi:hypothetical protein